MASRLPSLNGWRAISILIVLGGHCGLPMDGEFAVRFFFSISGFLITWLMLQEEAERGEMSLSRFYIRRCLRIWPLYFIYLAVAFVLRASGSVPQSNIAWHGALTFTRNFDDIRVGGDWVTEHFWSLSVEEQFYLIWPLLFCLAGNRARIGILIAAICFSAGFRTFGWLVPDDLRRNWHFFSTNGQRLTISIASDGDASGRLY